jgi:translation elongation factor EF-Ts
VLVQGQGLQQVVQALELAQEQVQELAQEQVRVLGLAVALVQAQALAQQGLVLAEESEQRESAQQVLARVEEQVEVLAPGQLLAEHKLE